MRISDWSSDLCSSDLKVIVNGIKDFIMKSGLRLSVEEFRPSRHEGSKEERIAAALEHKYDNLEMWHLEGGRSEEHTSELQSLMRISYAVFCLKKNTKLKNKNETILLTSTNI